MTTDIMKEKWEQAQLAHWKSEIEDIARFFNQFGVDFKSTYEKLFELPYDDIQPVIYLLGKMQKMAGICAYLNERAEKHHEDVDKIKLFHLISHAEIAMKVLGGVKSTNAKRVEEYFQPVRLKLCYRLRLSSSISDTHTLNELGEDITAPSILYKLRCEYAHQGNYLGRIFRKQHSDEKTYCMSSFEWDLKVGKDRELRSVDMETNFTFDEFIQIYFEALREHIDNYTCAGMANRKG
jgi:hypothetical protein